jgi:hypothetical protein
MKAITLHQPWASLIVIGAKRFETRGWGPPHALVGERIGIHAGLVCAPAHRLDAGALAAMERALGVPCAQWAARLPRGAMLCTARLAAAHKIRRVCLDMGRAETRAFRRERNCEISENAIIETDLFGWYGPGRFAWELADVIPLEPAAPMRGRQGLWDWEPRALSAASPLIPSPQPDAMRPGGDCPSPTRGEGGAPRTPPNVDYRDGSNTPIEVES